MKFNIFLASFLIVVVAELHPARNPCIHERREAIPSGFSKDGPAPAETELDLRLSLAHGNFSGLEDALYAVSTPGHARYGQHLSKAEVETFVAPSVDTASAVQSWLSFYNLTSTKLSPSGDWLGVQMTVQQANDVLAADFTTFTRENTNQKTIRTLSYSIPTSLDGHLNFIHPTTMFPVDTRGSPIAKAILKRSMLTTDDLNQRDIPNSCNFTVTPTCIQDIYGLPSELATGKTSGIGVSGFSNEFANKADLQLFLQEYRPDLNSSTTFGFKPVDGGTNSQNRSLAGSEADLDVQWTVGLASGVPVTFYSVGDVSGQSGLDVYIDLANALLSEDNPPQVFTTSYSFDEPTISPSMAMTVCRLYAQLGARGTTVIFSSGDGGVAGGIGRDCTAFTPTFPSTCPYVTSVGATAFLPPELAAPYSSGGFSNIFSRPSYQDTAVSSFLDQLGDTYKGLYNISGRAFPDVSAQGADMVAIYQGNESPGGGTSFSAPIIASTIALLNDELSAAGKAPLGFLNPLIYSSPDAFRDVTSGNNPGCDTDGFTAVSGWDPLSGVGTPIYSVLRTAAGL